MHEMFLFFGKKAVQLFYSIQQLKIVDFEGSIVPVNTPGEICIRGYCVMMGYWEEKEQTESVIEPSRWFHTG